MYSHTLSTSAVDIRKAGKTNKNNPTKPPIHTWPLLFCLSSKEHLPKVIKILVWWRPNMWERMWHLHKRLQNSTFSVPTTAIQNTYMEGQGNRKWLCDHICSNVLGNRQKFSTETSFQFCKPMIHCKVRCITSKETKSNFKWQTESSFPPIFAVIFLTVL